MKKEITNAPSGTPLGITSDAGSMTAGTAQSISTTKAGVLGYILGLAAAGIIYIVTRGKGKRSNASRSARPMPEGEPTPLPSTTFPVDVDAHDNDGFTAEVPENHHAPANVAKRKLTDEDVETIRTMKDGGKPVKEIATLYGVSPKTIYARLRKQKSNEQNIEKDGSAE